ncbi:MAG: CRISPR-associated endonuclease Cas2 [Acidimicrobiia bacterium]|nr:CRISPR-associated endonuclease Cas2 [Acidimicrobiia bacterium]
MSRRRYVLAYDIREPKRLREVHNIAVSHGEALQYSVFLCDLSDSERIQLKAQLRDAMDLGEDSVVFIDLGEATGRGTECFEFLGQRSPLPPGQPQARVF